MEAPSVHEVRRVAALPNPVLRNLEITSCYSRLATGFADRSGEGANWCTYATWASRQAGRTIRGEDLVEQLGRLLSTGHWLRRPFAVLWRRLLRRGLFQPETRLGRLTAQLHTPFDAFERASDAIARGNLKVFEEIGLEFARYLEECPPDAGDEVFRRFIDSLRPGDPPEGQRYLRHAFERYRRLDDEADPKGRAELAVQANLEIGFHEQTRLQPEIREALDAPYATQEHLGLRALVAVFPSTSRWWRVARRPAGGLMGAVASGAQREASRLARAVITDSFMVLSLPGRVLALGAHLEDPFPDSLGEPRGPELTELLARFEPDSQHDDCGARDWAEIDQRMHYMVHLFCAFHERSELARPPFTEAQIGSIARGVVPDGEL